MEATRMLMQVDQITRAWGETGTLIGWVGK